ncbi:MULTISPECIES: D-galactarate dehydratase [unclassified Yoonia]|uniref:D-galactarate dehydratase n=1 Tax=unclassified Yoonia TaxID=2629118 RepID=UPI002AFDD1CF|nr:MULTISPECIES: D-galactarate dehydratase [unclassified Yoonia]
MNRFLILPFVALAACDLPEAQVVTPEAPTTLIPAMTLPPPPPSSARTVDQFDTTSAAERQAATQVAAAGAELGRTIATLGSPTEPGIWLKTPLVSEVTQGRIRYQSKTINVELRPSGGAAGSGSQVSLAAMRLLEAPLAGIVELTVLR